MTVNMWGYSKCGTCRNAQKWLKEQGVEVKWIEIVDAPPSTEQLTEMVSRSGLPLQRFFNTSGELYRKLNMKEKLKTMTESEQLQLLANHGKLIKRPLCSDGERVTVGFQPQLYAEVWGTANES